MTGRRDRGGVLILTLVFTVVLAVVVVALASYAATGLRTSEVPTQRIDTNADAASAMNWAIEEFSKKQLTPDDDCGEAPAVLPIAVPVGLVPNGYTAQLTCSQTTPIAGEPVVHLVSTVVPPSGSTRVIEATVEVPRYIHGARVADWRVDIPIDVPNYVTTTTGPPASTSTTSTTTTSTTTTTTDPSSSSTSSTSSTTTTTLAPNPLCTFRLTSVSSNKKEGLGTLSMSNVGGGSFNGWQVNVSRVDDDGPWSFTWAGDVTVTGTYVVTAGPSEALFAEDEGARAVASAAVTNGPNGGKLEVNQTFACNVVYP